VLTEFTEETQKVPYKKHKKFHKKTHDEKIYIEKESKSLKKDIETKTETKDVEDKTKMPESETVEKD